MLAVNPGVVLKAGLISFSEQRVEGLLLLEPTVHGSDGISY